MVVLHRWPITGYQPYQRLFSIRSPSSKPSTTRRSSRLSKKRSTTLLFWAPLSIRGHSVIVKTPNGRWQATNVDNIPMHGVQIRMFQNLWDEWPSQQAFLKWGASMSGLQVDDWVCFSVIYYAGSTLPTNFRDLQYAFLKETYVGEV